MEPPDLRAMFEAAAKLHAQGNLAAAERLYSEILAAAPQSFAPLHMLGVVRSQQGRHEEALALIGAALVRQPGSAPALANRANVLLALGRFEAALADYDTVLALRPDFAPGWSGRGSVLREMDRLDEALASYDRALALAPDDAETLNHRGHILWRLGRFGEALASFDAALALAPARTDIWNNRGLALHEMRRLDEALASYDKAIAAEPGNAQAHWNKALCHLLMQDFAAGWPLYDWHRRLTPPLETRSYPQPFWSGREDLNGKTLFLYAGQGLGDTIQFYRYARLAAARGANVILSAQDSLRRLLRSGGDAVELIAADAVPAQFDYHAALMDLPAAFGVIAPGAPYLSAEPALAAVWKGRIGATGFKIGIAWAGQARGFMGARSFALSSFAGLAAIPGVRLISLQKDAAEAPGFALETFPGMDAGPDAFLDTVAAMEQCDLVITADTSVAHLAGALGRPAWVALRYVPDWRWFLDRDDSPWYPSLRLVRQDAPGDWGGVFRRIEQDVAPNGTK